MFVSRYVKQIQYDDTQVLLHNLFNGALYLLTNEDWKSVQRAIQTNDIEELPHIGDLKSESFLVDEELQPVYLKMADYFTVTIETTSDCNLCCTYCYENDKGDRKVISSEVMEHTLKYLESVFRNDSTKKHITVGFIGGETLLYKDIVISFAEQVKELCKKYSKTFNYHIDTNGTIPFADLYQQLENLHVSISLTPKEDHNVNRPAPAFDSFDRIVENLTAIEPKLGNDISIRYNTNEKNVGVFRDFVLFVKKTLPICREISPMYTDEYEHCLFKNGLSLEEFKVWNSTEAIDILIESGFVVPYSIGGRYAPCIGLQDYSCKVYADGMVTLCDSMLHDKAKCHISEISDSPKSLNDYYDIEKNYNPLNDYKCSSCIELARCMGKIFCRTETGNMNMCDYEHRFVPELLAKTTVKHFLSGNAEFLPNMI